MAKPKKGGEKKPKRTGPPTIKNRKAWHDYHIEDSIEAGVELIGSEVKSIRQGKVNLTEAFARVTKGELWLHGCHITPYENQNSFVDLDPMRRRRLLVHKKQIENLESASHRKGYTLMPLKIYFKKGYVKVEIGLGKGKKLYDKREDLKQKDADREMARALKR